MYQWIRHKVMGLDAVNFVFDKSRRTAEGAFISSFRCFYFILVCLEGVTQVRKVTAQRRTFHFEGS